MPGISLNSLVGLTNFVQPNRVNGPRTFGPMGAHAVDTWKATTLKLRRCQVSWNPSRSGEESRGDMRRPRPMVYSQRTENRAAAL